jgi:hypothetical protein
VHRVRIALAALATMLVALAMPSPAHAAHVTGAKQWAAVDTT